MRFVAILLVAGCGVEGPAGRDGADGADGTNNRITATMFCQGAVTGTVMTFEYSVALMEAGDIFASGGVYDTALFIGDTAYFSADQAGAATAPVIFSADFMGTANGGWWQISLNRTNLVTSIVYNDADATGGQDAWSMPSSDCVLNEVE